MKTAYVGEDIYRHAALAAGQGMHVFEVESGPTPVDDEHLTTFIERWVSRLSAAYEGKLRPL